MVKVKSYAALKSDKPLDLYDINKKKINKNNIKKTSTKIKETKSKVKSTKNAKSTISDFKTKYRKK